MSDVTRILQAIENGDRQAAGELLPLVYDELRRLATQKMAHEAPGQTLEATALVHEAYLRLVGESDQPRWENRKHFLAAAAEAMRRILVENARRKKSLKHGGGRARDQLDQHELSAPEARADILALDEALQALTQKDPTKAKLVELRYFAGLTLDQAADLLGISPATADRYWAYARAWLFHYITHG